MNRSTKSLTILVILIALISPILIHAQDTGLLAKVKARGKLNCGINGGVPGFGYVDPNTKAVSGFDTDFCRVIAAALFGDATAVNFITIAAADRFTALQSNEIDVLIRNTTYTFERDAKEGADFGPIIYYDGQTVMARAADKITKLADLKGATVCAIKGTTTEQNINDAMASINTKYTLVTHDDINTVMSQFSQNFCDAVTSDRSQLTLLRAASADPAAWVIFDNNISREPLTPAWKSGDAQWGDVVRWSIYATMLAEEDGITSNNLTVTVSNSTNSEVRRLLGLEGNLYEALGFDKSWALNIIKQVGNYGEIYDRNVGTDSPYKIPRGLNNLWNNGGLIYAPPYR